MNKYFSDLFSSEPNRIEDGVYYYDSDNDGDCFDEDDAKAWREKYFRQNWERGTAVSDYNKIYCELCEAASKAGDYFIEIACGPGMGLAPYIIAKNPAVHCLATDACSLLIRNWKQYYNKNLSNYNIDFAQFSLMDMPLKNNSADSMTSNIGLSSTRNGEAGYRKALSEVMRVLKPGGRLYAIENEWTDMETISRVFNLWGRENWFQEKCIPWRDRFHNAGFEIEYEKPALYRKLNKDDNDLGEAAETFGIEIGMQFTAYILRKPAVSSAYYAEISK